ncbi:hypothetical protein T265_02522 [Opisthorchis viverrini]|uniref:Uncharacterized protein n=1 Tax=Opisthorchis viverrini TaxID=6198 RepID=A0A075A6F9_OPIVI|nr:hypothetical protein T265_02522 [Opisthorchis viverrini]KER31200.1 hypothetical protein T265_02522 [Opisthorchis viverrini]
MIVITAIDWRDNRFLPIREEIAFVKRLTKRTCIILDTSDDVMKETRNIIFGFMNKYKLSFRPILTDQTSAPFRHLGGTEVKYTDLTLSTNTGILYLSFETSGMVVCDEEN